MVSKQTAIVVLGMHASGTSLVSHILIELGVNMGKQFTGPVKNKPTWENVDFMRMNTKILNGADGNWNMLPSQDKIEQVAISYTNEMREIVTRNQDELWGFKDPRTSLTISHWHLLLDNPKYIYVHRNPSDVANSILQRGPCNKTYKQWVDLVHKYDKSIQSFFLENKLSYIEVSFERLVSQHYSVWEVEKIASYIDVENRQLIENACSVIKTKKR